MAKARVEETVKKVVRTYHLELSEEEASTLFAITGIVTGSSAFSPRGHTSAIFKALQKAGLDYWDMPELGLKTGSISFSDYPERHRDRRPI